ncbi:hypothetical protein DAMA08_014100 [Martiniozyma asiatica (nom. inval.)]|nr:hypothetical protein DAMA08_014100 [Martiniozyma asiatica]
MSFASKKTRLLLDETNPKSTNKRNGSFNHNRNRHKRQLTKSKMMGASLLDEFERESHAEDIFTFPNIAASKQQRNDMDPVKHSETESFLSLSPNTDPFKFDSYLKQINISIPVLSPPSSESFKRKSLLNLSGISKYDVLQDRIKITEDNIIDEFELDCVVRASVYDSDYEQAESGSNDLSISLSLQDKDKAHDVLDVSLEDLGIKNINSGADVDVDNVQNDPDYNSDLEDETAPRLKDSTHAGEAERDGEVGISLTPLKSINPNTLATPTQDLSLNSESPFTYDPLSSLTHPNKSIQIFQDKDSPILHLKHKYSRGGLSNEFSTPSIGFNVGGKGIPDFSLSTILADNSLEEIKCSPHHRRVSTPTKSTLKPIPKNLLNLIVESSDGCIEDAVRFATEINAMNSQGIPLPEKTTELVNIPTNGPPSQDGTIKSAIIRGIRARSGNKKRKRKRGDDFPLHDNKENSLNSQSKIPAPFTHHLSQRRQPLGKHISASTNNSLSDAKGFYTAKERTEFGLQKPNFLISKGMVDLDKKKKVIWAQTLEW